MANKSRWMLLVVSTLVALSSLHSQWQRIVHPGADFRSVVLSGSSISAVGSWARWHTSTNLGGSWALTSLGSEDRSATVFYCHSVGWRCDVHRWQRWINVAEHRQRRDLSDHGCYQRPSDVCGPV